MNGADKRRKAGVLGTGLAVVSMTAAVLAVAENRRKSFAGKPVSEKEIHRPWGVYEKYFKRPLDAAMSLFTIVLLSPVFIAVALLVKIKLGSPVIFSQERPGLNGKIFKLYKFRTMTEERGKDGELLPDECRLTDFGKKLRNSSLDELPELFNILTGDMSFVGPRPLLISYLPRYDERQAHRHDVNPGLTGLAQIRGRNRLSWEKKFEYDVKYAEKITFIGDLKIILGTIAVVMKGIGVSSRTSVTMEEFKGSQKKDWD